jgi:hypothetical protein
MVPNTELRKLKVGQEHFVWLKTNDNSEFKIEVGPTIASQVPNYCNPYVNLSSYIFISGMQSSGL